MIENPAGSQISSGQHLDFCCNNAFTPSQTRKLSVMTFNFQPLKQLFWFAIGFVFAMGLFQLSSSFAPMQAWMTPSATTQVLIGSASAPVTENVSLLEFNQTHLEANYYQHS